MLNLLQQALQSWVGSWLGLVYKFHCSFGLCKCVRVFTQRTQHQDFDTMPGMDWTILLWHSLSIGHHVKFDASIFLTPVSKNLMPPCLCENSMCLLQPSCKPGTGQPVTCMVLWQQKLIMTTVLSFTGDLYWIYHSVRTRKSNRGRPHSTGEGNHVSIYIQEIASKRQ